MFLIILFVCDDKFQFCDVKAFRYENIFNIIIWFDVYKGCCVVVKNIKPNRAFRILTFKY